MLKTISALMAIALFGSALAQPQDMTIPSVRGKPTTGESSAPDTSYLMNYGGSKGLHEAAVAAFQAAYEAAKAQRRDRAMRLLLVSLRRETMAKALYDLGILCARDYRWEDALNFQREAQQRSAEPEVAKLAVMEIERLRIVMDLESTPAGQQQRTFDAQFLQVLSKSPFAALADLKEMSKHYKTRWEAPALEGVLFAEANNFPESLRAFEEAALLAPENRRQNMKDAAELARGEATFDSKRISADELWEKQKYEAAAKDYRAAWENSREHLDIALKAATGFLMADKVEPAVQLLSSMRVSATPEMGDKIAAMLKELGAISEQAKTQAAATAGASGNPSPPSTLARVRTLLGPLTTHKMELAAKGDPPLLDDKTNISHVPDEEITGGKTNLPLDSGESIYALYRRDVPAPAAMPVAGEPTATPAAPTTPGMLPPPLPPASAQPAKPLGSARRVAGDIQVAVSSDPPGALVTFGDDDNLTCTAPCQVSLGAGRHTWRATLGGYRDGLGVFNIDRGKLAPPVNVALDAKLGFVTIASQRAGLPIYVDGQKVETLTPGRLKLREGLHKVAVEIDGNMVTQEVSVRDGALMNVPF